MMKILCLSEMYPSSVNPYPGSFVHRQNRALTEKGVEIKVISPVPWLPFPLSIRKKWGKFGEIPQYEILDGIEIYHPRRPVIPKRFYFHFNGFLYYNFIRHVVRKSLKEFNIELIHAHVALPDGLAGALLAREIQRPLIITSHGKDTANAAWSTIHFSSHCKEAIYKAFSYSSKIIGVSHYVKRSILESYPTLEHEKIVVIQGGVDRYDHLRRENQTLRVKTILSVGALIPLKGHHFTIEAVKKMTKIFPNFRLIIVGEGEEKHNLIRQVEKEGLQNLVHFLNTLPHEKLLKLMALSDIFVLPSWAEGLGMVYLEAMALGLPVIGCKGQGIEDIVSHGETGLLVKPKDSEELSNLILQLLKDEGLRVKIGREGQKIVLNNYRWEDNAEKHVKLYQSLISKQSASIN
jgi:glycosyltransferase involved in cell wall biosynthesis